MRTPSPYYLLFLLFASAGVATAGPKPTSDAKADATTLFKKASKSVVVVAVSTKNGLSMGSGVVIGPGRIVTNNHVIAGSTGLILVKQGSSYWRAEVFRTGHGDLALLDVLLKVGEEFKLPPATLRSSKNLEVGERAYAIGTPRGLEQTLSEGLVSGISRDDGYALVQTTAAISPGSSGGGLFDAKGALIGITTLYLRDSQSLNFAIASDEVEALAAAPAKPEKLGDDDDSEWDDAEVANQPICPIVVLPQPLVKVPCYFVGAYMDAVATRIGFTEASVKPWVAQMLKKAGLRVVGQVTPGCAELAVSVDSMVEDEGVRVTYTTSIQVRQLVDFEGGGSQLVPTWRAESYGFAGSAIVFQSLKNALESAVNEFTAARLRNE